jgi:hypothetical protein
MTIEEASHSVAIGAPEPLIFTHEKLSELHSGYRQSFWHEWVGSFDAPAIILCSRDISHNCLVIASSMAGT